MKAILFFFLFSAAVYPTKIRGDDPVSNEMQLAEIKAAQYLEAKEYAKALDTYEALLKQSQTKTLTPWQRNVISYNIGSVLFFSGKYRQAIAEWSAIPLGTYPLPLLARRIHTNIAVALLKEADQIKLVSLPSFEKVVFLMQEAKGYVKRAVEEECAWQKMEGASTCMTEDDLIELEKLIESRYTKVVIQLQSFQLSLEDSSLSPLAKAIIPLLDSYKLALLDDPLQEETLLSLLNQQKKALEPFSNAEFAEVNRTLASSLQAMQQKNSYLSRFYLQLARFHLTKILRSSKKGEETLSHEILENAVEEQHKALILNRLAARSRQIQPYSEEIMKSQRETMRIAQEFKAAVYKEQLAEFQKPGTLEERCQANPWAEVLPLFDEGYVVAAASIQKPPSLEWQELIFQKWSQALDQLKKPKSAFKGSCRGSAQESSPKNQDQEHPSSEKETQKEAVPMSQVLQNIQKMEQEEREKTSDKKRQPLKGERPW